MRASEPSHENIRRSSGDGFSREPEPGADATAEAPIRILIADDHALVREGIRSLISTEPGLRVVGEAVNGAEAVHRCIALQPDVAVMDLVMPEMDGIEAIVRIKAAVPATRLLALTSFSDDDMVFPAIKAGALGYVLKNSPPRDLLLAIRHVHAGEASLDPSVALKVIRELNRPQPAGQPAVGSLSDRETEVLRLVAQGLSNLEIADRLAVSERTMRNHVGSILSKLHLANRTQAALYALRQGLAEL